MKAEAAVVVPHSMNLWHCCKKIPTGVMREVKLWGSYIGATHYTVVAWYQDGDEMGGGPIVRRVGAWDAWKRRRASYLQNREQNWQGQNLGLDAGGRMIRRYRPQWVCRAELIS